MAKISRIHPQPVSPILEKELRIPQIFLIIWTEKLYHSASGVIVNMRPFWEFHISFPEHDHICLYSHTPNFSCVQSSNQTRCGVNAHHLCGLQSLFIGNLERTVQENAFLFFCISNFRPPAKYLAYAMDSCWNAASGILGQGERALPFLKGLVTGERPFWKSLTIVHWMCWMVPRGCPEEIAFL